MTRGTTGATKLTYRDYVHFPEDGKRHEIIDGEHYVTPAPETYHQKLSRKIQFQLFQQIEERGLGEVYNAPTDVELSDADIVQPDLVVILAAKQRIVTPKKVKGIPDLVVEILSPATKGRDRRLKRELYRRVGVPEYWIVDPDEHVVEQHLLQASRYRLVGRHTTRVTFRGLEGVVVDLARVW
jgi:Uma2 family endonuclease